MICFLFKTNVICFDFSSGSMVHTNTPQPMRQDWTLTTADATQCATPGWVRTADGLSTSMDNRSAPALDWPQVTWSVQVAHGFLAKSRTRLEGLLMSTRQVKAMLLYYLRQEGYVFDVFVCACVSLSVSSLSLSLSVCVRLFVCEQHNSRSLGWILMIFGRWVGSG